MSIGKSLLVLIGLPCCVLATFASHCSTSSLPGLDVWRKPGRDGRACVSCHSPDGLELAAYKFSDADILRRAQAHLNLADAERIVGMIHDVRSRYHITHFLDPMEDRPLQPGGQLLQGSTPLARDGLFALTLSRVAPLLTGPKVNSLQAAVRARDQLMRISLDDLPIGIAINRLSEDVYHGKEHASIADWISDVPLSKELPVDSQDRYLADPTDENYRVLDNHLEDLIGLQTTLGTTLSALKRRSLLFYTHRLRLRLLDQPAPGLKSAPSSLWEIGEFGRTARNQSISALNLPADIAAKKEGGPSAKAQFQALRLSWMWLGWCSDPGLQHISHLSTYRRADYLSQLMWSDGPYPTHLAFLLARKIATESFDPKAWSSGVPQHLNLNFSGLLNASGLAGPEPTEPRARQIFQTFLANVFRMDLLLQESELRRTHLVYLRAALIQQIERIEKFLTEPQDRRLTHRVLAVIGECRDAER